MRLQSLAYSAILLAAAANAELPSSRTDHRAAYCLVVIQGRISTLEEELARPVRHSVHMSAEQLQSVRKGMTGMLELRKRDESRLQSYLKERGDGEETIWMAAARRRVAEDMVRTRKDIAPCWYLCQNGNHACLDSCFARPGSSGARIGSCENLSFLPH